MTEAQTALLLFLIDLGVLGFGAGAGVVVMIIFCMQLTNGAYSKISARRLRGMQFWGGVAAVGAGLTVLSLLPSSGDFSRESVFKIWAAQVAAAIAVGEAYRRSTETQEKGGSQ